MVLTESYGHRAVYDHVTVVEFADFAHPGFDPSDVLAKSCIQMFPKNFIMHLFLMYFSSHFGVPGPGV